MKKIAAIIASLLCVALLCSCGSSEEAEPTPEPTPIPDPLELEGEWRQYNSPSDVDYQGIYISDDYIEIYWILGTSEGAALYWAGTVAMPEGLSQSDSYEWKSTADTSRTTLSLLTDKSETKTFKYENGKILYTVDYNDVQMTVKAEKKSWGYGGLVYEGTYDLYDVINGVYQNFTASN